MFMFFIFLSRYNLMKSLHDKSDANFKYIFKIPNYFTWKEFLDSLVQKYSRAIPSHVAQRFPGHLFRSVFYLNRIYPNMIQHVVQNFSPQIRKLTKWRPFEKMDSASRHCAEAFSRNFREIFISLLVLQMTSYLANTYIITLF